MANPQTSDGFTSIANEIMEALAKVRIPGEARQVLDFILRKTYGWQKKIDEIALSKFVEGTGLSRPHICNSIQKLLKMKLIITEKGNENTSYGIQKDFEKWIPLPKKVTIITEKGNESLLKKGHTKESIEEKKDKPLRENKISRPTNPHVREFLDFYFQEFERKFKIKPIIRKGQDPSLVKNLLDQIEINELRNILISFFESEDSWIQKSGYTIGAFQTQVQKLRIKPQVSMGKSFEAANLWLRKEEARDAERSGQKKISYGTDKN